MPMKMLREGVQIGQEAGYRRGWRDAIWSTYEQNLAATAKREAAELERQQHARWHE
jgi:hypothetical protein